MALDAPTEQRLRALLDEHDIRDALMRYCRGVDRCDAELIASCYHDDAVDDHGNWQAYGRDIPKLIVDLVRPSDDSAMHFMGNVRIEVDGDTAFAESYLLAFRSSQRGGRPYTRTRALRFIDRFTRRDGQWRISERVVADEWNRLDEIVEAMSDTDLMRHGCKDRDDPVYAIRREHTARRPRAPY